MRHSLIALVALLVFTIPSTAHAQVSQPDLAPFVGTYVAAGSRDGLTASITESSGLILRWYFGTSCVTMPVPVYPCDPSSGNHVVVSPGGEAIGALWHADGDGLVGTILTTTTPTSVPTGPVRITPSTAGSIDLRAGEKVWHLELAR